MPINHLAPVSIRRTTPYRHQSSRVTFQFQIYTSSSLLWIISQIFFFLSILFRYSFSFFLSHCVNKIPLENYFTQFSSILFSSSLDAPTILLSIIFHLNVSIFLNYLTILSFLPPFSLDSKRYFSWYFVSTFNENPRPMNLISRVKSFIIHYRTRCSCVSRLRTREMFMHSSNTSSPTYELSFPLGGNLLKLFMFDTRFFTRDASLSLYVYICIYIFPLIEWKLSNYYIQISIIPSFYHVSLITPPLFPLLRVDDFSRERGMKFCLLI